MIDVDDRGARVQVSQVAKYLFRIPDPALAPPPPRPLAVEFLFRDDGNAGSTEQQALAEWGDADHRRPR